MLMKYIAAVGSLANCWGLYMWLVKASTTAPR